jgi:hypothetical protein
MSDLGPKSFAPMMKHNTYALNHISTAAILIGCLIWTLLTVSPSAAQTGETTSSDFQEVIRTLASFGDRSTGTPGSRAAANYIKEKLAAYGFDEVESHFFSVPVLQDTKSRLIVLDRDKEYPIQPMHANAITPETIAPPGLEGPLIYVGPGELQHFNGKAVAGSIVLMDLDSGKNWLHAANLGAKALIYVDRGPTAKIFFEEKFELSPIQFPRFWIPYARARECFGAFDSVTEDPVIGRVRLISEIQWQTVTAENIYCLLPGTDAKLKEELVIVEAFYDSRALVFGSSPGADEACSVATLLAMARKLKQNPSSRSILFVATGGHAQTLAGMREMIWSIHARSKDQRKMRRNLKAIAKRTGKILKSLNNISLETLSLSDESGEGLEVSYKEALDDQIKTESDRISRRLMQLRLQQKDKADQEVIQRLAQERMVLRRLGWRKNLAGLSGEERTALEKILPAAIKNYRQVLAETKTQLKQLNSARSFRSVAKSLDLAAVVSLHLSSHGNGFGAFNYGWLYPFRPRITRVAQYSTLVDVLDQAAATLEQSAGLPSLYKDTLRPSRLRSWQSYFLDRPPLGGEVSALAGYHGFSLVSINDARSMWGTPYDTVQTVNWDNALTQADYVSGLVKIMAQAPRLHEDIYPRNGFSTVTGRAQFLRQGELFADQPAPGSMILAYQGPARYPIMVDSRGTFHLRGVADKKHSFHKVILEGYKFDPVSGDVQWTIDKKKTGKSSYRVKMQRRHMETDLVMFACKGTTLFNLLEPRTFRYMTKTRILDGRREALPLRYFVSRLDTWSSIISTVYLEPGTRLKLTLSDNMLQNKLILTNGSDQKSLGIGYLVDEWPFLHHTEYRVARDMWTLLAPRISNLEDRGIFNERIRKLQQEGMTALNSAAQALEDRVYDRATEAAAKSWALASRVYDDVEKTQKDVLLGVLFYIALFVPFAFCLERLVFSYTNIYRRIIAFCAILILLIAVIYKVHPAFQLAYSPMVVILAFFIIGLSLMVTLIIFFRFESEMINLQSHARQLQAGEISRWKAFVASFFLGVSNLRRRRLRTVLTCATLVILTFTIMSFTSVKTMRHHARLLYQNDAPYHGILLKNVNWSDLPPEAYGIMANALSAKGVAVPRIWLEDEDRTRATRIPVRFNNRTFEAQGLVGMSSDEVKITGIDEILISGRWFEKNDRLAVLLPERMARNLGIDPNRPQGSVVSLWGMPFDVVGVFSGKKLQERTDLDGEPLTPVTFPREISTEMTEVEMEALESGEDVRSFQSRYQHISGDLTMIIPYRTLLAAGGHLKDIAFRPHSHISIETTAQDLVDRFGLSLFTGESDGTFLYHASDTMSYSGVPNIIIPLIISVFIVLNTMIGSVYERKREIAIYTSVGLAPSHVSFLFIAEAMAFAVLSVVMGYLLAQTSAKLFAETSLWAGITVNYSSLAGVGAMLLVILVVLVSVIYPSRVAGEIAIPDVNRSWTLPEAEGNELQLTLPFLMKHEEHQSIGGFIFNYFKAHQDVSHGIFSTGNIDFAFVCPTPPQTDDETDETTAGCTNDTCVHAACLILHTRVWLAPFDFGIMQQAEIQFCPAAEERGYLEIRIRLIREAGEANAWRRINKAFLHALRKQLLVWRSLDAASHDHYEKLLVSAQMGNEISE